jgi:hypothetical protein
VRKANANSPTYQHRFEVFSKLIHLSLLHYMPLNEAVYHRRASSPIGASP